MSVESQDVLVFVSEGYASFEVANATRRFARARPQDFAVVAAYHARAGYGPAQRHVAAWRNDLAGLAAILKLFGWPESVVAEGFLAGLFSAAREDACARYADALLRLDEWLLANRCRPEERDRRAIVWDIDEDVV